MTPVSRKPRPLRVLVAVGHQPAAGTAVRLLREWGFDVLLAFDGEAALEAARAALPDVVLLDLGLPGTDGWELARGLRGDPATRAVILVAVAAHRSEADRLRSWQAGIDVYLTKPVDTRLLHEFLGGVQCGLCGPLREA